MTRSSSRAVSSVVATILLVAVVVVLSATVSVFVLDVADEVDRPGPVVGQSTGELVYDRPGSSDQIVRVTHIAGDDLEVTNLEIAIDATDVCGKRSRIVNPPTNTLGPANYEGDDIFDYYSPNGGELDTSADGTWRAGETATFRLASTECRLDIRDSVTIRVVHTPTESVVIRETLAAT